MAKNEFIKRPNSLTEYTQENVQDLYRCAEDPVYFAKNFVRVQHPTRGAIPFDMYPYQERAIKGFLENRWCIMKCGRQMGKTTVISVYLLWFACFNKDKNLLVASKDNSGAIDIMDRIRYAYEEMPNWLKPGVKAYNRHSIEFDNGSTIRSVSTTENTGRGKSISLLMLDELAFVRTNVQGQMWSSLAPTLSTGGACIISSTPNGDSELFAILWREAVAGLQSTLPGDSEQEVEEQHDDFFPIEVEWDEHPDRDEKYRVSMIKKIGEEKWKQEYESITYTSLIYTRINGIKQEMQIGDLYQLLSDQGESEVCYVEAQMSKLVKRVENTLGFEILTPLGYQRFSGIVKHETECVKITLRSGSYLECSLKHPLIDGVEIRRADTLLVGDELLTTNGLDVIDKIESFGVQTVYDPTDVEGNNTYIANSIFINHNCQFLSSDPLLINTLVLSMMKSKMPLYNDKGFFFWKDPEPGKTYIVGVDVAEGLEKDFSTIQVIELETLEQIAEYRNNKVKENQLYDAIKYVLAKIHGYVDSRTGKRPAIYWSFENNSAGAALGALYYADEKFPEYAELINGKGVRLGMRTVNKTKVEACRHLKKLIEQTRGGLTINSKMLIFELKNYIMTGAGYAAKRGATDDLISAFLIVLRVMKYLSEFEPEVFDKLYKTDGEFYGESTNDYDDPIPFVV